jgi:hypothetical protein
MKDAYIRIDLGQKPPLYVNASLGTEGQTNTNKKHIYALQGYVGHIPSFETVSHKPS